MFRLRVLGGFALDERSDAPAPALPKRRAQAALSPDFDSIRNDPRYLALLRKYANPGT